MAAQGSRPRKKERLIAGLNKLYSVEIQIPRAYDDKNIKSVVSSITDSC